MGVYILEWLETKFELEGCYRGGYTGAGFGTEDL